MKCPKCGFEQPDSEICESCGVVVAKFVERRQRTSNPTEVVKAAVARFSRAIDNRWIDFAPSIHPEDLWAAMASYPVEENVGRADDVLALFRERDFDKKPANHALITTRRFIRLEPATGRIYQLELSDLRSASISGIRFEKLKLNEREFNLFALTQLKEDERKALLLMLRGIIRELGMTTPPQPFRVNHLMQYQSYQAVPGDGRQVVDSITPFAVAFVPQEPPPLEEEVTLPPLSPSASALYDPHVHPSIDNRMIDLGPAADNGEELELETHETMYQIPPTLVAPSPIGSAPLPAAAPVGTMYVPPQPPLQPWQPAPPQEMAPLMPGQPMSSPVQPQFPPGYQQPFPQPMPGQQPYGAADDEDDLIPPAPVSPGRWLVANLVGLTVGSVVGLPIGMLFGKLIHLPGSWPYYLGLILGTIVWTGVANAIKSSGGSLS